MSASVSNAFSDLFYGNPFSTPVGSLVEESTESFVGPELWQLFHEVCSNINQSATGPKDAVRAIRRRFLTSVTSNETVAMHTLLLLEACVQNCGYRFRVAFATRDNLRDFAKFATPDSGVISEVVKHKLLSLIQDWALQFGEQVDFQELRNVYTDLRARGVSFPQSADLRSTAEGGLISPKVTPESELSSPNTTTVTPSNPQPSPPTSVEHTTKLEKDLSRVRVNICVLSDLIDEAESDRSAITVETEQLMSDIVGALHEISLRLIQAISCWESYQESLPHRGSSDAVLLDLINVNDELHTVLLRYSRSIAAKRQTQDTADERTADGQNPQSSTINGGADLEFASFVGERPSTGSGTSPLPEPNADDEVSLLPPSEERLSDPAKDATLIDF